MGDMTQVFNILNGRHDSSLKTDELLPCGTLVEVEGEAPHWIIVMMIKKHMVEYQPVKEVNNPNVP